MKIFQEPISASILGAAALGKGLADGFRPQKAPRIPTAATPEGDREAERKAGEEADRRARAAVGTSRQQSILAGGAAAPQGQRRTLLGGSTSLR